MMRSGTCVEHVAIPSRQPEQARRHADPACSIRAVQGRFQRLAAAAGILAVTVVAVVKLGAGDGGSQPTATPVQVADTSIMPATSAAEALVDRRGGQRQDAGGRQRGGARAVRLGARRGRPDHRQARPPVRRGRQEAPARAAALGALVRRHRRRHRRGAAGLPRAPATAHRLADEDDDRADRVRGGRPEARGAGDAVGHARRAQQGRPPLRAPLSPAARCSTRRCWAPTTTPQRRSASTSAAARPASTPP